METVPSNRNLDSSEDLFREFPVTGETFLTEQVKYSSPYRSAAEKLAYVRDLPSVIVPFLRAHFEKHASALAQIQQEQLPEYTSNLKESWRKHLAVNDAIDTFLNYEFQTAYKEWSITEWRCIRDLIVAAFDSDLQKGLYSAGIKKKLDTTAEQLKKKYASIENFEQLLLTPSFLTFYETRDLDQKKYDLSVLSGKPDLELRAKMIDQYCAGDEGVFELRDQSQTRDVSIDTLAADIAHIEASAKERAAKKGYLMSERPDIKDFEELLKFDNALEYEYTYSLRGLPDLFLREEVLKKLIENGKLDKDTNVFSVSKEAFLEKIDEQLHQLQNEYNIRVRTYRQNYDTCGTACVMSVLNRKGLPLTEENELKIWEMVGKPFNFPGGLAWVLQRHHMHTTFVQDDPHVLNANNPEFSDMSPQLKAAAETYVSLHEKASQEGMKFEVSDWGYDRVRSEIERGNLCLVYIDVSDTMTHVILAHGYRDESIRFMDPLQGTRYMNKKELDAAIVNPMGKRMVIVKKLPEDIFNVIHTKLESAGY